MIARPTASNRSNAQEPVWAEPQDVGPVPEWSRYQLERQSLLRTVAMTNSATPIGNSRNR